MISLFCCESIGKAYKNVILIISFKVYRIVSLYLSREITLLQTKIRKSLIKLY